MDIPLVSISVDLLLIARCFVALLWGFLWAMVLQHTRLGQFWAAERTWLTVVIGVGVDLALSFGGDWFTVAAVVAFSSVGIIWRSLSNEAKQPEVQRGYKALWSMEDAIAVLNNLTEALEQVVEGTNGERAAQLSRALRDAHLASQMVKAARRGEYEGKR
jgi:hypothetical protein